MNHTATDTRPRTGAGSTDLVAACAAELPLVRALCHEIHAHPEVGLHLPHTQARVLDHLRDLDLELTTGNEVSSVVAVLRGTHPDRPAADAPVVLLRGDMDALPVAEETGLPQASTVEGTMHACGHDQHTAALVGAARVLAQHRDQLAGDVVFMFQPGEEMQDGAAHMVQEGVLRAAGRTVDEAYALHVMSNQFPLGQVASRPGPMMAAADGLRVTLRGRGGHGSMPHTARDPLTVACEMVLALQTLVTRHMDAFDPVVVNVGSLHSGSDGAPNAVPETASFFASVRSWSPQARTRFRERATQLVDGIAAAYGITARTELIDGYPVTTNDPACVDAARAVVQRTLGEDAWWELERPLSGSEDFSRVLAEVPGAFLVVGAVPEGVDPTDAPSNHSSAAVFDDGALEHSLRLLTALATDRLLALAQGTEESS
ncbi:M20 family metallopeptidase [Kytococcus sedentarius]|uniref:M20 metallopeptidase family protein n=1 Tax=Kytococcus sedentarius TaxID=1276 RepID=UPI0035BBE09D